MNENVGLNQFAPNSLLSQEICFDSNGNVTQRCLSLFCTSAAMIVLLLSTPASATFLRFCMNAAMLHLFGRKEGYCINVDVCVCVY